MGRTRGGGNVDEDAEERTREVKGRTFGAVGASSRDWRRRNRYEQGFTGAVRVPRVGA